MEYRGVNLHTWKEVFRSPVYPMGTNNLGEFLAIYDAIRYIEKKNKKNKIPLDKGGQGGFAGTKYDCIFSDSETAIARVKSKKIKTTLPYSSQTKDLLTKVTEAATRLKTHNFDIPIRKRETEIR